MGHYLASFIGSTSGTSALELTAARGEIDLLRYQLEQVESKNGELAKELSTFKEALQEAQEMINRRDDKLRRAERRIENLERQRSRAERD